jgi:type I restriction enzyme, S subunit
MSSSMHAAPAMEMRRFKRYPAYKGSGVEWLGEIPAHWDVKVLKRLAAMRAGTAITSEAIEPEGEYPVFGGNGVRGYTSSYTHDGEFPLVGRQGALCGCVNFASGKFWASEHALVTTAGIFVDPHWLAYVLKGMSLNAYSQSAAQPGLAVETIGAIRAPVPEIEEQRAIVAFLDRETARIDELMAKKAQLLELLQEKRTTLITHAVTKGVDPTTPMTHPRVEWLGQIPAHWKVSKVKRLCLVRRGASPRPIDDPIYFDDEGEYAWVRIADVTASDHYLQTTTQRLSPLGKSKSVALEPGELFVSIAATVGKPIITKIKCCIHDGFVYFVGLRTNREYLYYLFACGEPYKGLGKLGTQLNLNTDTIGDIYVPLPPPSEQQAIVQFLDRETARLNILLAKVRDAIDSLKELRAALISGAVTGKIDVRGEVA